MVAPRNLHAAVAAISACGREEGSDSQNENTIPHSGHLVIVSLPKLELRQSDRRALLTALLWEHFDLLRSEPFWK